ncbi:MAG: NTP transferase domain-containing protein, partial [Flavobacteriales bacterium]|nr:NTP transferase domain-containing protein [Flavobacteriales bacterium]
MELTYTQFEVLQLVVRRKGLSKSELCSGLPFTQEVISRTLKELTKNKLVNLRQAGIKPTQKAWDVLEPYRVKRAVILAAGMGTRMRPETQNTPKPMVRVGNKRIIETQIEALLKAGIDDITIVRGYLSHKFDVLLD